MSAAVSMRTQLREPATPKRLYHGGVSGLGVGDIIRPGHSRDDRHPGCPICSARQAAKATKLQPMLDPSSLHDDQVYVTVDKEYARYYASLYGRGDLYQVEPVGTLTRSNEDFFPSYSCPEARVLAVYARLVDLTWSQRRRLYRRWAALEGIDPRTADFEFERMVRGLAPA